MSSARLIAGRRGSCPRIPRVDCCPPRWRVPFRTPTGPLKHPHALPQRDSGIDGTMRRPVAAVEARRSQPLERPIRLPSMEEWVGKEGGAESLSVPGILCGFPSMRNFKMGLFAETAPNTPTLPFIAAMKSEHWVGRRIRPSAPFTCL